MNHRTAHAHVPHIAQNADVVAKTTKIKGTLDVAAAELVLTNEVLEAELSPQALADPVVARALEHNLEVEERLVKAGQELAAVTRTLRAERRMPASAGKSHR